MIKAYRRGRRVHKATWEARQTGALWWFGAGTIPAWQVYPSTVVKHFRYQGHHRATRFTQSVDDVKADLVQQEVQREAAAKRLREKWLCDNRVGDWHLNADGTHYCWHAKLAIAPGLDGFDLIDDYVFTIEVPQSQLSALKEGL